MTIAISEVANEQFHPHDFERIQKWWRSHDNEYTNWPVSELEQGLDAWGACNYTNAAKLFEAVVKLDASADESRALAICSWSEIGETNQVARLAKGFKSPTERWAEMAAVKVELETGNVSNATIRLAEFTRKNPMMSGFVGEGSYAWRRIDWELFHKMISNGKK